MVKSFCTSCREHLDRSMFTVDNSSKNGLSYKCKECKKNPLPVKRKRECQLCGKVKTHKRFLNEKTGRYSRFCKLCLPKYGLRLYYIKAEMFPEKMKAYHREYKRKYRKKNN